MPERIVAPVVVKPLTVSKSASTYEGINLPITKGSAPTAETASHARATIAKPSLANISLFFVYETALSSSPAPRAMPAEIANAITDEVSFYMTEQRSGSIKSIASRIRICPVV